MANSTVLTPQVTPAEVLAREARSNSLGSNGNGGYRTRSSADRTRSPARSRQASLNYAASDMSDRESFISGIGGGSDDDELDLDADDIPVTGFAVASARRNQEFHEMFPTIPEGDYLIEDYGCALQREILVQGRLYISENHVCFHANIFGWVTDLTIPMYDVTALEKRMTAFVIPNAIQITTPGVKYTFTSFLSRDTTFDVIYNVWRLARPEDSSISSQLESARESFDVAHDPAIAGLVNGKLKTVTANKVSQCGCGKAGQHYTELAMDIVIPGTPEKIYNLMFTSGFIKEFMRNDQKLQDIQISDWMPLPDNPALLARNMSYIKPLNGSIGPKSTKCEIRDECGHCDFEDYVSMITTTRTPDVPSGSVFSVKTRTCITWASSVSSRIQVTSQVEWTGRSFIKGIIERSCIDGQKTYHGDLEKAMRDYIHEHKSEFIPEGVDPAVVEETENAQTPVDGLNGDGGRVSSEEARVLREKERNARGLQWAYDTFEGAMKVAKQSTEGALELIKDAWDQSSTSTIQYFVIVVLVISNVWTLMMMGGREETGRRKELKRTEEREKWVQSIVTSLWDELTTNKNAELGVSDLKAPVTLRIPGLDEPKHPDLKQELAALHNVLNEVEQRVASLRKSLQELD
ncbi:GRAM-domain-containing protein [Trametopsis cervina]|nr:GRAM-domain-containing protein [Trametopsis cervina]